MSDLTPVAYSAFTLWLRCETQEAIAEAVSTPAGTIPGWEDEFLEKCQAHNPRNPPDFTVPLYNVWKLAASAGCQEKNASPNCGMNELTPSAFDYGDLPAEKVMECETAFQAACLIENQAVLMIGEQFSKVKANLRFLRNGNGFREWCENRAGISYKTADNYINAYENKENVKNFHTFGKSALFLLTAPNIPQEVRDRADALVEAGEDASVKAIKQLKAEVEAERQARELYERRARESQAESNERRLKIRSLEAQVDLLKAQADETPKVVPPAKIFLSIHAEGRRWERQPKTGSRHTAPTSARKGSPV